MMWKDTTFLNNFSLNFQGKIWLIDRPQVIGILNLTPDSFFDGGKYNNETLILQRVEEMLEEGADILDLGAYSSRPGADHISQEEELKRLIPALSAIAKEFPSAKISVDTFRSEVAKQAIDHGAGMINDISGGILDQSMFEVVAKLNVPYVIMHMRGNPQSMNQMAEYEDLIGDLVQFFSVQIKKARNAGISDLILDPGFGFAKNLEGNYLALKQMSQFKIFNLPLLVGFSRKSMVNKVLNINAENALNGTTVLNTIALLNNAVFLRVHDVKEAVEAVKIVSFYQNI